MGDTLSLAQAAKLAGVTLVTMRKWIDEVPGVERSQRGEYRIPRESLMGYLAHRDIPPKARGIAHRNGATATAHDDQLLEYLQGQMMVKDRMIDELRAELREAQGEVRKLEVELRAHLSGGGLGKALSRWLKG